MECPKCETRMHAARINGRDVEVCRCCGYRAVVPVKAIAHELMKRRASVGRIAA
jgi:DNA-directed RNA polymerase subunit M/transcription elongation factor TFIIS